MTVYISYCMHILYTTKLPSLLFHWPNLCITSIYAVLQDFSRDAPIPCNSFLCCTTLFFIFQMHNPSINSHLFNTACPIYHNHVLLTSNQFSTSPGTVISTIYLPFVYILHCESSQGPFSCVSWVYSCFAWGSKNFNSKRF